MSDKYNRVPDFVKSLSEDELEELNLLLSHKKCLGIHDQLICSNTIPLYDSGMAADISACTKLVAKDADIITSNNYEVTNFLYANVKMTQAEMTLDWLNRYNCSNVSFIDEGHPDWDKGFNVHRRSYWLPSIELKIGLVYMLKLGKKNFIYKQMELVNIIWNNKNFPDLYFREYDPFFSDKYPMNISYTKVLNQIDLKGD